MYISFVNECLLNRKAVFFDPIKKINLDIGSKKTKKIRKAVSVMKGDRQAFGVMFEKPDLEESFRYPVTSVPLSYHLIDVSKACELTPPNEARWIMDTISDMRAIRVKET